MQGPEPATLYPLETYKKLIFLKHFIKAPNIHIGDYTYYDDRRHSPESFEQNNILYNDHPSKVKLVMGKFCAIAAETKFIMTGDHKLDAFSTYPFPVFKNGWESAFDVMALPVKGDIIVGHDVWFGYDSLIASGVKIGNGAIIASRAVVVSDVPDYAIVGGNPARVLKMRFDEATIKTLNEIAWWDWDASKITRNLKALCHLDLDGLLNAK